MMPMIGIHLISTFMSCVLLLIPIVLSYDRQHSAWDAFNVEKIDDHMAHEHRLTALMFGMSINPLDAYFEAHDTDHNTKLDGLELLHALHHQNSSQHIESTEFHFQQDSLTVDLLLLQADSDSNGFIDYYEYVQYVRPKFNQRK